ncbi:alpha/beta fold hydrolase [Helicobacter sp. MIT 03-1614]|uniref:alpha/beta fold hydrolase n=1 Tax=Helicobacter sp. MIT 03-1614 TaxID=1548147 RepID=UPI000A5350B3|nr:alpha/beta hydrolase [Helicobacter sp. MIT 03-1614]
MQKNITEEIFIQKDNSFISAQDGLRIFYDVYMPSILSEYVAVIQVAHGMVEHKGRYEWVGKSLAKAGFIVAINDHRGHGKSIDRYHIWGEMKGSAQNEANNVSGFDKAVADMHQLTLLLKQHFKPQKFVLLGHSMGSLLARSYLKSYKHELDTLILSGSPAYNPLVGFGQALAQMLNVCRLEQWGKHLINNLSFGSFNKPFLHNEGEDNTKGGFAWLCRDKAIVEAYKADSACQFIFSLESFIGLFEGMRQVNDMRGLQGENLPLLIISGSCDSCGDFGAGVEKIAYQYEQCGFNVELILYEGARHEILNEINKEQVLEDILNFI